MKQSGYDAAKAEFEKQEEARMAREAKEAEEKAAAAAAAAAEAEEEAKRKELEAVQEKHDKAIVTDPEEPKVDPQAELTNTLTKVLNFLYFSQVCHDVLCCAVLVRCAVMCCAMKEGVLLLLLCCVVLCYEGRGTPSTAVLQASIQLQSHLTVGRVP